MRARAAIILAVVIAIAMPVFGKALATIRFDAFINERLIIPDDGQAHEFVFTSTTNNLYDFMSFGDGMASAQLFELGSSDPITVQQGFSFTQRLNADTTYVLSLTSQNGQSDAEIMRSTLGRSFSKPIELIKLNTGYDKAIARAYDTHWFKFTTPSAGIYSIRSESDVNLVGYLLDSKGRRVALSDNLYSPYCLDFRIVRQLPAGEDYYIRVSGRGGETGKYRLVITMPQSDEVLPESISLSQTSLTLNSGDQAAVDATFYPDNSIRDAVWFSSDNSIATVDQKGVITAKSAGNCWIILSGLANADARISVVVNSTPITDISFSSPSIEMRNGETRPLEIVVSPSNARSDDITLESSNEDVVAIGRRRTLFATGVGFAKITATSSDGNHTAVLDVTVSRAMPVYRALVMAQQKYSDGRTRTGSINTAQGIVDLFANQSQPVEVTMKLDTTRSEAISAIRDAFSDAKTTDVSILYLSGHGGVTDGRAWIEFHDGKRLTSRQLERELRSIPGTIVLMIDSCQSGAFISTACKRYNSKMLESFSSGSATRLASSKYRILASSCATQDSYRFSADGKNTENSMSTAFGRALTEAGGWDLVGDRKTTLRADINGDNEVTLHEAYLYSSRRVRKFLSRAGVEQDVQVFPFGSQWTIFS